VTGGSGGRSAEQAGFGEEGLAVGEDERLELGWAQVDRGQRVSVEVELVGVVGAACGVGEFRAKVLAAVGARLPAGQREALFREALRAITTIGGKFTLDAVWRTVAALLPVELLTEALALTPKSTPNPAIAVLDRAARLLPADGAADYLRLLRAALTGLDRPGCLAVIAAAAEAISVLGGPVAVRGCADAIGDAERWWP
jgi:hypothetical protein